MAKQNIITRKIELNFDVLDNAELPGLYERWFLLQNRVREAANLIVSHQFIQGNANKLLNYMDDKDVNRLVDSKNDDAGILTCSPMNTTYRIISKEFLTDVPSSILASLNSKIVQTFKKEQFNVSIGKQSLRSYRNVIPIPFMSKSINGIEKCDDGNYKFDLFNTPFKTYFGRGKTDELIMDRAISGDYKLCDSEIIIRKVRVKTKNNTTVKRWRLFLLLVVSMEKEPFIPKEGKKAICELSIQSPIIIKNGKGKDKDFIIGNNEEFLHGRIAINGARKRLQRQLKYGTGGKGRKKKLQAIERFEKKEKNYVDNRMHKYSRELVDYCLKNKIGEIVLSNYETVKDECADDVVLLPNWSYYNLAGKIVYKAAMHGIVVTLDKDKKDKKEEELVH